MGVFSSDPKLFEAIGRVAAESAQVDEMLREMISDLLRESADDVWILFEGQSSEWLSDTFKTMLAQVDFHFTIWPSEDHSEFRRLLGEMTKLRILRNVVVHGTWREEMVIGCCDGDDYTGRPWGDDYTGDKIFWCIRSRQRKGLQEREFTISDVERIASEIADTRQELADLFRKQTETHPGAGDTLRRWPAKRAFP